MKALWRATAAAESWVYCWPHLIQEAHLRLSNAGCVRTAHLRHLPPICRRCRGDVTFSCRQVLGWEVDTRTVSQHAGTGPRPQGSAPVLVEKDCSQAGAETHARNRALESGSVELMLASSNLMMLLKTVLAIRLAQTSPFSAGRPPPWQGNTMKQGMCCWEVNETRENKGTTAA